MKNKRLELFAIGLFSLSLIFLGVYCVGSGKPVQAKTKTGYVHTSGQKLLDENNKEVLIKGIAFGNNVWSNPSLPPVNHHTENSYKELNKLGFNSIRFYINYGLFENDNTPYEYKQSGWDWLDKNIAWAKKYKIKLVLNMHYPQGGFQSNGNGMELWTDKTNQARLTALWKAIAKRYKNEPTIMAYDLLNEPVVAELSTETKTFNQWKDLATKMVTEIRKVDKNHLIIIERLNASKNLTTGESNWNANRNRNMNFFLIKDNNIAYEFHVYSPMEFTHQNASWISAYKNTFSKYPDMENIQPVGNAIWKGCINSNPKLSTSSVGWQYLQGERFKVNNTSYLYAQPTLQAKNVGSGGTVWFDDIVIKEYDENYKLVRTINNLDSNNLQGWSMWQAGSSKGEGNYDLYVGHEENGSYQIKATTDDANLSCYGKRIKVEQGHSYEISGYVYGKSINTSSEVRLRLDFYSADSLMYYNKDYLESVVKNYLDFGIKNNVPLYLGEFGCIKDSFLEDRGGEQWVSDMLDICKDNKINYNYHTYHEEAFGLYQNSANLLPAKPNMSLMEVFRKHQK